MHLYVIDDMSMDGAEHTILKGSYTYPALFDIKGEIILFSREQPAGKMGGDLVAYRASDGFSEKRILMESRDGEVVYAAIPFIADDEMLVAYALHRYSDQSMRDFHVASFGLKTWEKKWECDLGYLVEGAFYNRPTAIAKKDSRILVGTSFFDEAAFLKAETDVFSQENKVLLVEGSSESCASFHVVYERDVAAPYYNTDVNINENLDFVFFNADSYYSNLNLDGCFLDGRNIYPRMVGRKMLIFSRMNGARYNIRNFDNSLYVCRAGMIDFH
ncbi:hypothetical protein DD235_12355 [Corticimicrobacter populi]|uniref:Uncharacterized protein n=2 Tax=Corticimicrobacter populi TaxID=2175229 RepID=A0A2V1JXU3_9BURK|nr:hypothetical protein DD235_12355 [Corticimicrobacter populi]